ncbi:MAG TPA: tryptophan 7-halogenase [Cellvibrio sp.]
MTQANQTTAIKRIIILGAGMTGWTAAAGIAKGLAGLNIHVVVVDDPTLCEKDDCCEVSMPSLHAFHKFLQINESELVATTGSAYMLATEYRNWSHEGQRYFLPFSDHGFMLQRMEFAQYFVSYVSRAGQAIAGTNYDAYSLAATAASMGRFRHPSNDPSSLLSTLDYGLQLNGASYTNHLLCYAKAMGVEHLQARVIAAGSSATNGLLTYLKVEAGSGAGASIDDEGKINGDFFIDCTGQQAWLKNHLEAVNFQACPFLRTNSAVSFTSTAEGAIPSASKIYRDDSGWYQQISTQNFLETRYYFNGDLTEPDQVIQRVINGHYKAGADVGDVKLQHYRPGNDRKSWVGNCLAIGRSAGHTENFVVGKLHLVQSAVLRFLKLFPSDLVNGWQQQEYNRLTQAEFAHLADFHALHYHLANDVSSVFWREAAGHMSDSLQHRLRLFHERATIPFYENETVSSGMWSSLLLGCRFSVASYNPLINLVDSKWVNEQLTKMQRLMAQAAGAMPSHAEYLNALVKTHKVGGNTLGR